MFKAVEELKKIFTPNNTKKVIFFCFHQNSKCAIKTMTECEPLTDKRIVIFELYKSKCLFKSRIVVLNSFKFEFNILKISTFQ